MSVNASRTRGWVAAAVAAVLLVPSIVPQAVLASAPTDPPTLTAPDPGASVGANPTLQWNAVAGAVRYRVQVGTSNTFSTLVYNVDTFNTKATPDADLPTGTLYWRVAGMDGSSNLGPYSTSNFTRTWAASPVPTSPADGATLNLPDDPILLTWQALAGARSYRLEVDDAPDFVSASTYTTNNTSYALTEPQTVGQTFYWHVQGVSATSGVNSGWSPTRDYQIAWPSVPTLVSPPNTNLSTIQDVVLDWNPVPGAKDYEVQINANSDFSNNMAADQIVFGTSYAPPQGLNNGSFFWRVRARDTKSSPNFGDWSDVWTFTRGWPDRPTLLTPTNANFNVVVPHFSWTPIAHAAAYEIQVGTDQNFSPSTYFTCQTNHTDYTPYRVNVGGGEPPANCDLVALQPGTLYYWRVRGVDTPSKNDGSNAPAYSLWSSSSASDTFSFIYRPAIPTLVAPANGSSVVTPVLQWNPVPGEGRYRVTVIKANGSTAFVQDTYALSYTPPALTASDGPFKWTVQTIDANDRVGIQASLGSWRSFSLAAPTYTNTLNLLTPADGSSSLRMPAMTWEPYADDNGTPLDTSDDVAADHYIVYWGVANSGVRQILGQNMKLAGYTYPGNGTADRALPPGNYFWEVEAYNSTGGLMATSADGLFTIAPFDGATYVSPDKCVPTNTVCQKLPDTPTLAWNDVPGAGGYIVYVRKDANFTTAYREYWTIFPTLTPRESYLDSQAGQAYYWFVVPCFSGTQSPCGPFNSSVYPNAYAFQKKSAAIERTTPDPDVAGSFANEVTFRWRDYLATNGDLSTPATQEARWYRILVSNVADYSSTLDVQTVDQTAFTSWDKTYPEGPIYWKVQALDGSDNQLTFSTAGTGSLVKSSPKIALTYPAANATVSGVPYFTWTPQSFAAEYEIQIARNGDTLFSSGNLVFGTQRTKLAAWSPTTPLSAGDYAWRVHRLDVQGRPGPWSDPRLFTFQADAPALTSPADDYNFTSNNLLFSWSTVQGAAQYRFQSSTSSSFTGIYENQPTVMTSWAPFNQYADNTYYWRVQVLDSQNNVVATSAVRSFRKDATSPTVIANTPTSNAPITGTFDVTFSEPVTNVSTGTFTVLIAGTSTAIGGSVTMPTSTTARFTPSSTLIPGQSYTASVSSAIVDLSGNALAPKSWTVRTDLNVENNSKALYEFWDRDLSSSASGGSYAASRTGSTRMIFGFTGTSVTVVGHRVTDGGYANVYLDGVLQSQVSFYASANQWQIAVWSKSGLTNAKHTVEVRPLGTKPTSSTNSWVYVDAFKVGTVSYEESNTAVRTYFRTIATTSASGSSYDVTSHIATSDTGGKPWYQLTFKGTGFDWYATRTAYGGTATVYIDNVAKATIDLYSATTQYQQKVYASPTLTNASHVMKIFINGSKQTASKGLDVTLDRVAVR